MINEYMIPVEYIIRDKRIPHDDRNFKDEYQNGVCLEAKSIVIDNNYKKIVDVGCGSAFKLLKYFNIKKHFLCEDLFTCQCVVCEPL